MISGSSARIYQWVLVAVCAALFTAWELVDHTWLMQAPMKVQHELQIAGPTVILILTAAVVFHIIDRYERELRKLNAELRMANEALKRLEATRDERLLSLASDLGLSLADLIGNAQIALQSTTDLPNIKTFSRAIDRAQELYAIAHDLLELKQLGDGVVSAHGNLAVAAGE